MRVCARFVFPVLLAVLLSGCAGTYKMQGAHQYEEAELATLDTSIPYARHAIFVVFVDGKPRGIGLFDTYLLVPGERVITVRGNHGRDLQKLYKNYTDIVFMVEAGKSYELVYEEVDYIDWRAWIIDQASGERADYEQTRPHCTDFRALRCTHAKAHLNEGN